MNRRVKTKLLHCFSLFLMLFQNAYPVVAYAVDNPPEIPQESTVESTPESTTEPQVTPEPTTQPTPIPEPSNQPESTPTPTPQTTEASQPTPSSTPESSSATESIPQTSPNPPPTPDASPTPEPESILTPELSAVVLESSTTQTQSFLDLEPPASQTSASISTNKADYAPNEQVVITGSGLNPDYVYSLVISSSDQPPVTHQAQITTTNLGAFVYVYQLDGNYRPNYKVEIFDGTTLAASTTFTDSPSCQNDVEGANDEPGQKDLTRMCADYASLPTTLQINWNWDDLAWSGGNTGDGCALFDTDNDSNANYSLCVTISGSPATYQSKTLYSCGDSKPDRCTNPINVLSTSASTACTVSQVLSDPFSAGTGYPTDTNASCSINMSDISATNAKLIDVCSYPSTQPNSDPSDCIVATQAQTAKLEIVKNLVPDNDTGRFDLYIDGSPLAFSQGDGGTTGEIVVLASAQGVSHTFAEAAATGTNLTDYSTSVVCRDNNGTGNVISTTGTNPWTINIVKDKDIVCTITNSRNQGTLIVNKVVINDNGGTQLAQNFSFQVNGDSAVAFEADGSNELTVAPGTYTVTEPSVSGYATTYNNCTNVNVPSGGTATCTITNNDIAPTLKLVKTVTNDNGGTAFPANWNLTATGSSNSFTDVGNSTTFHTVTAGVIYTLTESGPAGYTAGNWSCDSGSLNGNQLTLSLNQNTTCTINNDDNAAHLIVIKHVINDNGGSSVAGDFTMTINGPTAVGGNSFAGAESPGTDKTLTTIGNYNVTETGPSGYSASFSADCSGTIALGETKTCTITNDDIAPQLTVIKQVTNDNGGTKVSSDFTINVTGTNVSQSSFPGSSTGTIVTLNTGSYSVDETNVPGYAKTLSTDCSGTIAAGESKTCTIINNDIQPLLTVTKIVTNDNGGTKVITDFPLFVSDTPVVSGVQTGFSAGTYTVTETNQAGYSATIGGDCASDGSITLQNGDVKSCTITNDDQPGTLIVKKVFVGETGNPINFSFSVNGGSAVTFEADAQNDLTVNAGTYTVTETNPGNAYTVSYKNCSNIQIPNGGTATCVITNTKLPTLTVNKVLSSIDPGESGKFNLLIDGVAYAADVANGGTTGTIILPIGAHTVSETAGTNTTLTNYGAVISGDCALDGSVNLAAGDNKSCTITNVRKTGQILLDKILFGGSSIPSDWAFSIAGWAGQYFDGQTITLPTGTYTISESSSVLGYTLTAVGGICDNMSGLSATLTVTENGGTCSFTNTRDTGSITVNKLVDTNNDGTYEGSNTEANNLGFTWSLDNGSANAMGITVNGVETTIPGVNHFINENLATGYHFTGWFTTGSTQFSCANPEGISLPIPVAIIKDQTTNITLCNARDTGTIVVYKDVQGPNGEDVIDTTQNFTVTLDGSNEQPVTDGGSVTYTNLPTGNYTVGETNLPTGYSLHSVTPTQPVSVTYGQTTNVYLVNRQAQSTITVVKTVINDHNGQAGPNDFGLTINGQIVSSGQSLELPAYGNYAITEAGLTGYQFVSITDSANNPGRCPTVLGGSINNLLPGENVTCVITNDDQAATIIITKDDAQDTGTNFSFSGGLGNFDLDDDNNATLPNTQTFSSLAAGTYAVTEATLQRWALTSINCVDPTDNSKINLATKTATIQVGLGETVSCTFTNNRRPQVTVIKHVVNDNSGNLSADDFTMRVTGVNPSQTSFAGEESGTLVIFDPGSYSIDESVVAGYAKSLSSDCSGTLAFGDQKTCTVTNDDIQPLLTVTKVVINDNGGNLQITDFPLFVNATPVVSGVQNGFNAGNYTISETNANGYTATISGDCNTDGSVSLGIGDVKACTITNDDQAGTLIVKKIVINDNGGTLQANDFTFQVDGESAVNFEADGQNNLTVNAGTYTVTEPSVTGYQTSYDNCEDIIVANGGTATCTITNDDIPPSLTLVKQVITDNGGSALATDWTLTATGPTSISGPGGATSSATFSAGTYTLSETGGPAGYTPSSWNCIGGTQDDNQITLTLSQSATCTITNDDIAPTITLIKSVVNDNGGNAQPNDFALTLGGNVVLSNNANTVSANTPYTINESQLAGYIFVSITGDEACPDQLGGTITALEGQNITCTITNDDVAPTITLIKVVEGIADPNAFGLTVGGESVNSGETTSVTANTPIALNEAGLSGYSFTSLTGDTKCPAELGGTVTLDEGEAVTCTITNTRDLGGITINKIIDQDGDLETLDDQTPGVAWTMDIDPDGADTSDPSLDPTDANGQTSVSDIKTGTYWVSEAVINGYNLVQGTCSVNNAPTGNGGPGQTSFGGVEVQKDTTTVCTFYNTPNGTIHGYKWHDTNADGTENEGGQYLGGWTINLYRSNGEFYELIDTMVTDSTDVHHGWYWFEHLFPGEYKVCESLQEGWQQTYPLANEGCHLITLPDGNSQGFQQVQNATFGPVYKFGNVEYGSITIQKTIDPQESEQVFDFNLGGEASDSAQIAGGNSHTFTDLLPGSYNLTEIIPQGWYLDHATCDEESSYENGENFTLSAGEDKFCSFHNKQFGTITVIKYNDLNENGQRDENEQTLSGWEMNLSDGESTVHQFTEGNGQTVFQNLFNQTYFLSETLQDNWVQTQLSCEGQERILLEQIAVFVDQNGQSVFVPAGENINCVLGNHHILPVLSLAKSNDSPNTKAPGDIATYTLTVTLTENDLPNVQVIDLPPNGFTYVSGSWTANSSVRGDIKGEVTTEPTYASPGTWQLGDMVKGEIVTLTYQAKISGDQQDGNYPDLAWAYGMFDGAALYANETTGNFVSTSVAVGVNPNPTSQYGASGQVLGASTELPSTGAKTLWLFIAFGLITTGFGLRYASRKVSR